MFSPNAISPSNPCLLLHHQPQKHVFPIVSAESQARSFPSENFRSAWQFQSPLPGLRRDSFQFNGTTIQRGFNRMTSRHRSTALSFIRTTNDLTLGLAFASMDFDPDFLEEIEDISDSMLYDPALSSLEFCYGLSILMLHCYYKRILSVEVMKYQVSCTDTRTLGVMVGFSIDTTVFEFRDILEKTLASIGLENPNPQRISNSCQEFDIGTIKLLGAFSKPKHMCKRDQNEMICKINKDPQMLLITGVPPFCLSTPPPCTSLQYHMSYRNRA